MRMGAEISGTGRHEIMALTLAVSPDRRRRICAGPFPRGPWRHAAAIMPALIVAQPIVVVRNLVNALVTDDPYHSRRRGAERPNTE